MKSIEKAILRTLVYADIFGYPLTPQETFRFLISESQITSASRRTKFQTKLKELTGLSRAISTKSGYFYLNKIDLAHPRGGRLCSSEGGIDSPGVDIIKLRQKRAIISNIKLKKAQNVVRWLRLFPAIQMVGVTGALAMMNAGEQDDIDLLIIVSPRRLWLTRGLVALFLRFFGRYRRSDKIKDRFCPNLYLDEEHLALPTGERNLFTAHEIAQVRCLWGRGDTYQRFLHENEWVLEYLPNAFNGEAPELQSFKVSKIDHKKDNPAAMRLCNFASPVLKILLPDSLLGRLEIIAYHLQLHYMRSKRTREVVDPGRAFFHPRDRGREILARYNHKLKEFGISSGK